MTVIKDFNDCRQKKPVKYFNLTGFPVVIRVKVFEFYLAITLSNES